MCKGTIPINYLNRLKLILVGFVSLPILSGCEEREIYPYKDFQKIYFFRQSEPTSGERVALQALIRGKLTLIGNCLLIDVDEKNQESYSPIWPGHYRLVFASGTIQVREGEDVVAVVGNKFQIGGGEIGKPEGLAESSIVVAEQPFGECPGPYWLVGERV